MRFRFYLHFGFFLLIPAVCFSGEGEGFEPHGRPFATIYVNFHRGITGSAVDEAAFELMRGYIGYEYYLSPAFYAKINVDVGSPEDLSPYSKARRYAYFKNAYLRYSHSRWEVDFGLIGLRQFKLQERIWERRYLMKTLADEHRLGSSADLGVNIHYLLNDRASFDFTMMNGEGYSSLQMDDTFKYSLGSTIKFPRNFVSWVVFDISPNEHPETTITLFSSYDFRSKWNIAGEFILRQNDGWKRDHNILGFSIFGKYNLTSEYQLFVRYDKVESNIVEGETYPWHLASDGTSLIAGLQFQPIKNIKAALNYHDWYPWAANLQGSGFVYLYLEVKM